jgi:hypothetical protein
LVLKINVLFDPLAIAILSVDAMLATYHLATPAVLIIIPEAYPTAASAYNHADPLVDVAKTFPNVGLLVVFTP